jgi:hypothetical protein
MQLRRVLCAFFLDVVESVNLLVAANGMSAFLAHTRHGQRRVADTPFDTEGRSPGGGRGGGGGGGLRKNNTVLRFTAFSVARFLVVDRVFLRRGAC